MHPPMRARATREHDSKIIMSMLQWDTKSACGTTAGWRRGWGRCFSPWQHDVAAAPTQRGHPATPRKRRDCALPRPAGSLGAGSRSPRTPAFPAGKQIFRHARVSRITSKCTTCNHFKVHHFGWVFSAGLRGWLAR